MSFAIALTASTSYGMILSGCAGAGVGASVWLLSHYVTKGSTALLEKIGEPEGRISHFFVKALNILNMVGEVVKFASLYGAGIGISVSVATIASTLSLPAFPIVILGSSCAAIYALSQAKQDAFFQKAALV